ncbi:SUMF1/EgtB/PvdO family nonheme iron enzyme [Rhizobium sp. SG570]|uniref:SUMF1/EgtB/PvdO family nonheme iron enzyme n=1 Tax=Rhizobium sp. SG570 TaxID=2587113 RepID=UPI0014453F69|nr:SUMF1/EgtB/PvdO family nonheme iron enzyme [Rhizobium sp. SG570]
MSENWAICIGINRYDNLKPLEYAQQDAQAMSDFFRASAHFSQVYYLAEDAPPLPSDFGSPLQSRPTFGNLMRFLRVRFEQPFLRPSDNLWFFFAGHGRREREQDYLLPIDADPGNVEETGISVQHIAERLKRCGADNVILLLDACRNEGARDGQGLGLDRQQGAVTVCSCSPSEFSYEIAELGHGAFTYGLLEGLGLEGPQNCATVERLDNYLKFAVPDLCRKYGKPRQTPSTFVEPLAKRHFILLPARALPEDLEPLKLEALEAEANGNLAEAEQLWWRINAVAPADAQTREGIRRITLKQPGRHVGPPASIVNRSTMQHSVTVPRRVLLYGIGAAGLVATIGAGAWVARTRGKLRPSPIRAETVPVTTVNDEGTLFDTRWETVETFSQPVDAENDIEFSLLPAHSFKMGSPDGELLRIGQFEQQVDVTVGRIAVSRTTITQRIWRAVIAAYHEQTGLSLPMAPSSFPGDDRPVETVTWLQVMEFCARLSKLTERVIRLPSETEWERACRADTLTAFHFGSTLTPALANYCGTGGAVCGMSFGENVSRASYADVAYPDGAYAKGPRGTFYGSTKPVRSYPPNRYGLFEMHGNVWEHCLDNWNPDVRSIPHDGRPFIDADSSTRVLRGGSFSHNPAICRSAYRDWMKETTAGWEGRVGFRVVCEV